MNTPHLSDPIQTQDSWQVTFAFQVFHLPAGEWQKKRWGFSPAFLLEEALDRQRLFIESQAVNEETFLKGDEPRRTLSLRGINLAGIGLQMALLGKVDSPNKTQAQEEARNYARGIFSIFPHDFLLHPAESQEEHDRLFGTSFFAKKPSPALIQRANAFIPLQRGYHRVASLWQSSVRANEQIWRALANMQQTTAFNIIAQPSILYKEEKEFLSKLQKEGNAEKGSEEIFPYTWVDNYVKRRLAAWKIFFLLQVHVLAEGATDNNLLRSIGSALTQGTNDMPLPGFQTIHPGSTEEKTEWCKRIYDLDFVPSRLRIDDIADIDEVLSVFRFPYRPETGLPGTNFINPNLP